MNTDTKCGIKVGDLVRLTADRFPDTWRGSVGVTTEEFEQDGEKTFIMLTTRPGSGAPAEVVVQENDITLAGLQLTDEQLEHVVAGMSPQKFSEWRASLINDENR